MQRIAIYDLDRTILRRPTFTAFLISSARQTGRGLWWRLPCWAFALIGYKMRLYGRKRLKQLGIRLFVGASFAHVHAQRLAKNFAASVSGNILPGASAALGSDRQDGRRLVIATAAMEFYVSEIAVMLGIDDFIATRSKRLPDGYSHRIDGENCYGAEKLRRFQDWMAENMLDRRDCHIRFYSDHPSDSPLLDFADEAILVGGGAAMERLAQKSGWQWQDFESDGR